MVGNQVVCTMDYTVTYLFTEQRYILSQFVSHTVIRIQVEKKIIFLILFLCMHSPVKHLRRFFSLNI